MTLIYLDSADLDDAKAVAALGVVAGITTNPTLMARAGRPPLEQLALLLERCPRGPVFHQVQALAPDGAWEEAQAARALDRGRIVLKLPATRASYQLGARLVADGASVAITGVYAPGQALLAAALGARWVIPYVDRARRLDPQGADLVTRLAAALRPVERRPRILAASLKTPEQVVAALVDGADAVTIPLTVIEALAEHPLTQQAIAEFGEAAHDAHAH